MRFNLSSFSTVRSSQITPILCVAIEAILRQNTLRAVAKLLHLNDVEGANCHHTSVHVIEAY